MDRVISTMTMRNTKMPWHRSSVLPLTSSNSNTNRKGSRGSDCSTTESTNECFQVLHHSSTRSTDSTDSSSGAPSEAVDNCYNDDRASRGETETPSKRTSNGEDEQRGGPEEEKTSEHVDNDDEDDEKKQNDPVLSLSMSFSSLSTGAQPLKHQIYKNRHALFAEPLMLLEQDMKTIEKRIAASANASSSNLSLNDEDDTSCHQERLHRRKNHLELERKRLLKEQERWHRRRAHRRQRQVTQEQRERFEYDMIEQLKEQSSSAGGHASPGEDHDLWKDPSLLAQG